MVGLKLLVGLLFSIFVIVLMASRSSAQSLIPVPTVPVDAVPANIFENVISPEKQIAHTLFTRITGTKLPLDHRDILAMESLLKEKKSIAAAEIATNHPNFINITIRQMAAKMSNRTGEMDIPLNDMMATIMGIVRDNLDAREMLVGNFSYQGDPNKISKLPMSREVHRGFNDSDQSSFHYKFFDRKDKDIQSLLIKVNGQKLRKFLDSENEDYRLS